jgi:tetratricopeptide (TPR) repeat protein
VTGVRWFGLTSVLLCASPPLVAQRPRLLVPLESLELRAVADSNDAPAHYEVALAYWFLRKYDEAEKHLRKAIAIEPHTAAAYLALSYLPYARRPRLWDEEDNGKVPAEWQSVLEEAWRFRRQAFLIDPLVDLKPLALMIPPSGTFGLRGSAYTYVMNGLGSFWDGQYDRAYLFLHDIGGNATEAERKKFGSWFLWYEGLASAHTGDFARAEADFRMLLVRADSVTKLDGGATLAFSSANHYRYTLAVILNLAGKPAEAASMLQETLTNDVGLYMAHVRLAEILEDQHRPRSALEERRRAVAANPEDATLLFQLGEALTRAGELTEAQAVLRQARQANPLNVRALYVLGFVDTQLGSKDEAQEVYQQFLALAPSRFSLQKAEVEKRLQPPQ